MTKYTILALFLLAIPIATASAYTAKLSEAYTNDIYIYGGERLYLVNNDDVAHTVTSYNGTFDTTILNAGKMTDLELYEAGSYPFYDKTNPSNTGVIHVIPDGTPQPQITTFLDVYDAGTQISIIANNLPVVDTDIDLIMPSGTVYQSLSLTPTNRGLIQTPLNIPKVTENGIWTIQVAKTSILDHFEIQNAVTEDEPTVPAPQVTNGTADDFVPSTFEDDIPTPSSGGTTQTPTTNNTTTPTTNQTSTIPATIDKDLLLKYAQEQLKFWQQMILFLNSTAD